ncbi:MULTISPECIES: DUF1507 family protein [Enterococcus]|uniref:Uncharacterized protein n=1 Tax=Enterococcus sulfureus ATCC 49903 TaxID=1140003 RepID=S0NR91_9ENTE|nr:DUF1507 family protein [Enterococcus sulfureus]EOT47572.1 hypothetical protein OMY_00946 [Enterococcus sulfureus ATCC 49903]EOT84007.1 hypothetical protein I573_01732 [Enterococcus sulfureus ATCC 49903]
METITPEMAYSLLLQEADRIRLLIQNQQNRQCISQCKAFEEVVDTQMYGLSRQIAFATTLGVISSQTGHQLLSELEQDLNVLYTDVYEEQKLVEGKEG